jgi:hypothetical protein
MAIVKPSLRVTSLRASRVARMADLFNLNVYMPDSLQGKAIVIAG